MQHQAKPQKMRALMLSRLKQWVLQSWVNYIYYINQKERKKEIDGHLTIQSFISNPNPRGRACKLFRPRPHRSKVYSTSRLTWSIKRPTWTPKRGTDCPRASPRPGNACLIWSKNQGWVIWNNFHRLKLNVSWRGTSDKLSRDYISVIFIAHVRYSI